MINRESRIILVLGIFSSLLLSSQELTQSQIDLIKNNPNLLDSRNITEDTRNLGSLNNAEGVDFSVDDDAEINTSFKLEKKSDKFGFDYIKKIPKSISTTSDLPVPNEYTLSLGDSIRVILTGGKQDSFVLKVDLDGTISIPDLGIINIYGESFSEVKRKIKNLVEVSYVGTEASVSLQELAAKKINIIGAVANPGIYIVNPFTTVSSALAYSGGFEEFASLRNIRIIRNGDEQKFDLYDLLIFGDRTKDANVLQGDTIIVDSTSNFVEVTGEVLRPFIYEYTSSDTYRDLIYKFGQGPTKNADLQSINVERLDENILSTFYPNLEEYISSTSIEKIKVFKKPASKQLDIEILGNGVYQKSLKIDEFDSLEKVINSLEFSDQIYPFYANLEQYSDLPIFREKISFSIADPNSYKNIEMKRNSKVKFYSRDDIEKIQEYFKLLEQNEDKTADENKVASLSPNVLQSFNSENKDQSNIRFQMLENGVFLDRLNAEYITQDDLNKIYDDFNDSKEIFDTISKKSIRNFYYSDGRMVLPIEGLVSAKMLIDFYALSENHDIENTVISLTDGTTIKSYENKLNADSINSIYIPKIKLGTNRVTILGSVKSPGVYDVPIGTTLNDLYDIANGFLDSADLGAIVFTRDSIKEKEALALEESKSILIDAIFSSAGSSAATGTGNNFDQLISLLNLAKATSPLGRLTGNLEPNSPLANSLVLEDGDSINIVPQISTVSITGQVLQPLTVTYKNDLSLEDYISFGGGYTDYADVKKIYVIRKDGTSFLVNNRPFRRGDAIMPGDTIVVPRDLDKISTIPLISAATSIISNIAFAAASLNSLSR